ncbi:PQQ-binding-like beta-propeller repeat protein [Halobacterium zhouii]|uniref:outer membrane protein assembly factor BamB family protein n=1 Tax=Halobacterium zhouii TaxID=2902624 RepID=UPI001E5A2B7E|nr:PQQ-binding-like beta-propeller repeat protein [Halobacterium zhouii]
MVGRRDALAALGTAAVTGLAGCTGVLSGRDDGGAATPQPPSFDGPSWRQFGGGPGRRGRANAGTGPEDGGSVAWTADVGDMAIYGSVVAGNTVFHAQEGTVVAYAAADGSQRWKTDGWSLANTPTFAAGSLYVPNDENGITVVDPTSGEEQWNVGGDGVYASPTVVDGTLYAVQPGRGVVAFDLDSRERVQTIQTETGHALAAGEDALYVRGNDGLLALRDGDVASRIELPGTSASYPVVGDGLVYTAACGDRERLVVFDPASGESAWTHRTDVDCGLSGVVNPALGDETLVWAFGSTVVGLDSESGDERWTTTLDSPRGVAVGGETAYVMQTNGTLVALDSASGDERWRVEVQTDDGVGTSQPMVVGDRVYVHDGRTLAAVDPA